MDKEKKAGLRRKILGLISEADAPFDESTYLRLNPDVFRAIREGFVGSGREHYETYGRAEGRKISGLPARDQALISSVNIVGKGLEIDPSFHPLFRKSDGYDVDVVDHLPTEELREKYAEHEVPVEAIEVVDYV